MLQIPYNIHYGKYGYAASRMLLLMIMMMSIMVVNACPMLHVQLNDVLKPSA
jgi:hypothetical protein